MADDNLAAENHPEDDRPDTSPPETSAPAEPEEVELRSPELEVPETEVPDTETPEAEPPELEEPEVVTGRSAEPASAAAPVAEPEAAAQVPGIAATVTLPPREGASPIPAEGEGGEWDLLTGKVRDWLASGQLQQTWQQARTPLSALLAIVAAVLVLRIYSALLGALDGLPLVPRLLELVGVIWLLRHGLPKLLRSSERRQLVDDLNRRWQAFRGRG